MIALTLTLAVGLLAAVGAMYRMQSRLLERLDHQPPADDTGKMLDAVTRSVQACAGAIGESVAAALTPPPPSHAELVYEGARQLATDRVDDTTDDSDPTDTMIPPPDRADAMFVAGDVADPFGVPGVQFPEGVA